MAKDSDEAADRPWNGDKAGWIEAEKLFDRKIYDVDDYVRHEPPTE